MVEKGIIPVLYKFPDIPKFLSPRFQSKKTSKWAGPINNLLRTKIIFYAVKTNQAYNPLDRFEYKELYTDADIHDVGCLHTSLPRE